MGFLKTHIIHQHFAGMPHSLWVREFVQRWNQAKFMLWLTKIFNGVPVSDLESKVFLFWHLHLTLSLWVQILYPHAKGTSLTLFLWHFCLWKFWKWGKSRIKIFLIFYYSQYIFQYSSLIAKVKGWTVLISNKCNILIITNKVTIQFGGGGEINFSVSVHVFIIKILPNILYFTVWTM